MTIRRLGVGDVPQYRQLMLEGYERHPEAFTSSVGERAALPASWWEARVGEAALPPSVVFGAFDEDRMVGVAGVSFETREKARHKATLFGMYVPPQFRHRGIGRRLVIAVLDHARSRPGVRLVQLTVTDINAEARTLYERCGFIEFGIEPIAVALGPSFVSNVHMWCDVGCQT